MLLLLPAFIASEEEALTRMLTLHHRSLVSDQPLPLSSLPASAGVAAGSCSHAPTPTGSTWESASFSPWLARYVSSEVALLASRSPRATEFELHFRRTADSLISGDFPAGRKALHSACTAGKLLAHETEEGARATLDQWVQDCTTVLHYVPTQAPVREDHKRLLMLLHDLGATIALLNLVGSSPLSFLSPVALGPLADSIVAFGESNRKTALSRALAMSADASRQDEAVDELARHGLCEPGGRDEASPDIWAVAGVRVCATLLLRARRPADALSLLKALVSSMHTLHAFISAFEVASRLPLPSGVAAAGEEEGGPPLRFTQAQMLEILDAALAQPQHALASEGNLLRWHLERSLRWGVMNPPSPPLACPPPQPAPLLTSPRVLVVVPFVASEAERLQQSLRRWARGGKYSPCASRGGRAADGNDRFGGAVDLMLYAADPLGGSVDAWLHPTDRLLHGAADCFRSVYVRHANLTEDEQFYVGGWQNTGPNNLFYRLMFDESVHSSYDALFWMEADVYPISANWLQRLREEAALPRGYWRKGPAQQPKLSHAMVSTHHYHMNSAGFYRLNQPCFVELLRRVRQESPVGPHDVSTHLFLHDPAHFHIWQQHAHRFLYTDLVQNRLDHWTLDDVHRVSPDTVFVHGKLVDHAVSSIG